MSTEWVAILSSLFAFGAFLVIVAGLRPSRTVVGRGRLSIEVRNPLRRDAPRYRLASFLLGALTMITSLGLVILLAISPPAKPTLASVPPDETASADLLGKGYANVQGPATIRSGGSGTVQVTVSLTESLEAKDVIWEATPPGQPAVKAGPASPAGPADTFTNLLNAQLEDVPIYSRMRARLDAPTFNYLETDWVDKQVNETAAWVWVITPQPGISGTQELTVAVAGPDGSGYEEIVLLEIDVISPGPGPIGTPTPMPTATPTPLSTTTTATPVPLPPTGGEPPNGGGSDFFLVLAGAVTVGVPLAGLGYWAMRRRLGR